MKRFLSRKTPSPPQAENKCLTLNNLKHDWASLSPLCDRMEKMPLSYRQGNFRLSHVFPFAVCIGNLTLLCRLIKKDLGDPFVGINFRWQRCGIGNFKRHKTFPLRFERRDIDNDAAAGIS